MLSPLPRRSGWAYSLIPPAVSAFPERVVGSACASSLSRLARRSLALRRAHSRGRQFVTRYPRLRYLHDCSGCFRLKRLSGGTYPLESATLSRRTLQAVIGPDRFNDVAIDTRPDVSTLSIGRSASRTIGRHHERTKQLSSGESAAVNRQLSPAA